MDGADALSTEPLPTRVQEQQSPGDDLPVAPSVMLSSGEESDADGAHSGRLDHEVTLSVAAAAADAAASSVGNGASTSETVVAQEGSADPETLAAGLDRRGARGEPGAEADEADSEGTASVSDAEQLATTTAVEELEAEEPDEELAIIDEVDDPHGPLKVLVCSHSHPEISKGGAEIAAFALFRGIGARDGCRTWFLGCDRREKRSDIAITQPFGDDDYLYSAGEFDWFKFANRDPRFPDAFAALLGELRPDVVHFHHYINFGVEAFQVVRRVLPRAKIVVTLHEYLAICNHHGQMVTHPHRNLCYEASPVRCVECFKQFDESDFFLRQKYVAQFFSFVDHFVSPSGFLRDRYVAWGLPAERISVIENVVRPPATGDVVRPISTAGQLRVGFFGQLSFLKGAKILFEAAQRLEKEERTDISIEVYGDYRSQPPDFQKELIELLEKVGDNIKFHGPYDQSRVDMLMQSVDAVIVPSVWWENSPLVIQEAFRNGRPVICSDIGGMAEKVRDGIDGFHFPVGSPLGLAALLKRLADERTTLAEVAARMQRPPTVDMVVEAHLAVYRGLREEALPNVPALAAE